MAVSRRKEKHDALPVPVVVVSTDRNNSAEAYGAIHVAMVKANRIVAA